MRALGLARRASGASPKNVLFVQLAESGTMVLVDPAIRRLTAQTGAEAFCVTFAANRPSLAITGTIAPERIFTIRTDSPIALLADTWRFLVRVRRCQIDTVVDFELFSRLTAVLCLATGARRRAGFDCRGGAGLYRGDLYTHPVAFDPHTHMARNYLALVEAVTEAPASHAADPIPEAPDSPLPTLELRRISAIELDAVQAGLEAHLQQSLGATLVLVNANASDMLPQRRWPRDHFVALVRALLADRPDVQVLLIGAADDRTTTAVIATELGDPRCVDVAGLIPLEQFPALCSLAAAMVTNDSGPAHFAAVTALPVIALFGPETPVLFRPLGNAKVICAGLSCSPCVSANNQRRTRCTDNQCMQRISVAEVLAATLAVLPPRVATPVDGDEPPEGKTPVDRFAA